MSTPKEKEVLSKKDQSLATTITKDDLYGSLNQKESEEIFNKLKSNFLYEKSVLEAYKLMQDRKTPYVNVAHISPDTLIFPDDIPHSLGELVLIKEKGLVSRFYDSDFGFPFEENLTPTHLKIFGINYTEILSRVEKWNKTKEHENDCVVDYDLDLPGKK